jgi:hypothetical protein
MKNKVFKENQILCGNKYCIQLNGANHPPKKNKTVKVHIKMILLYSAKKNKAKPMAEYSTLYPDTNSASASGKSKGCLLVSANVQIKNIINIGNKGNMYQ